MVIESMLILSQSGNRRPESAAGNGGLAMERAAFPSGYVCRKGAGIP